MYRILIVDDELHVVEALRDLLETQTELELEIITAQRGADALALFAANRIDVLFLDIHMPCMSGLDVLARIRETGSPCRVIFLTGHSRFDYIYEATRNANTYYILKSEDNSTILQTFHAALQSLEDEKSASLAISQAEHDQILIAHLLNRETLHAKLNGTSNVGDPLYLMYGCVTFHTDNDSDVFARTADLALRMKKTLGVFDVSIYNEVTERVVIFVTPKSDEGTRELLMQSLDDMVDEKSVGADVSLAMWHKMVESRNVPKIYRMLREHFERAIQATEPVSVVAIVTDDMAVTRKGSGFVEIDTARLRDSLRKNDISAFKAELARVAALFGGSMHNLRLIEQWQKVTHVFIDYIALKQLEEEIPFVINLYQLYTLDEFKNWEQAFEYLGRLADALFSCPADIRSDTLIAARLKEYIAAHIADDLSVSGLAGVVNYNARYVSRVFQRSVGENITRYVTNARIAKSCELLRGTNESIQAIAQKVGFNTPQYFTTTFRQVKGIGPNEYRHMGDR